MLLQNFELYLEKLNSLEACLSRIELPNLRAPFWKASKHI